ncbi:MAG: hypothetical protein KBE25_03750 [Laribacter sp.]|nr:hypothetical protein [Laribacter sp.]MBP9526918.1 hypothetical protein [Laribacter sp.]MBP9608447.1 hypothetical protein [Laribacter sp.]
MVSQRLTLLALWVLCLLASVVAAVWMLAASLAGSSRAWRLAVAHDQLANTAFGGAEDETISSRAGKGAARGVLHWCIVCRLLDKIDPGHCARSIEPDEGRF